MNFTTNLQDTTLLIAKEAGCGSGQCPAGFGQGPMRVRFAPSPTGHLHIGGLRAALFNWLFARHNNGVFLLRIEDTDLERSRPEYTQSIMEALEWCGIKSDEPIVIQSQRVAEHRRLAQQLLDTGKAYKCYCSQQELERRLGAHAADGGYVRYDGLCRPAEGKQSLEREAPFVIRFRVPDTCTEVVVPDLLHGDITFGSDTFDDFILVRSDGSPMYNFVVVADDAFMRISHIIRGEEHLVNTPRQILLYQALGFVVPLFAHLPLILGPDGRKLSKRDAATAVIDYKKDGYLAQALCNYLVRLGWSHGDQELFTRDELVRLFSLDHVGKKGSIFDTKKLLWMNGLFLRQASAQELITCMQRDLGYDYVQACHYWTVEQQHKALDIYKERAKTLIELYEEIGALYRGPEEAALAAAPATLPDALVDKIAACEVFTRESLELVIKAYCTETQTALSAIGPTIRFALTGKTHAPGMYDLLVLLGKDTSLDRLYRLRTSLRSDHA